jgi:hypothetical protein
MVISALRHDFDQMWQFEGIAQPGGQFRNF